MRSGIYRRFREFVRNNIKMAIALTIIGILTVVMVIITYFTSWSEVDVDTYSTVPTALGSDEFYSAVESITGPMLPLPEEGVTILNNGNEFEPDLIKEIKNAKSSITVTNYIFKDGEFLDSIIYALTERALAGIEVRVLMDAKGSLKRPKDKLEALELAGAKVEEFRPLWNLRTLLRGNKRTHMRAIVVDGRIGYIGGVAFDDEWLGNGSHPDEWRDMMFKFSGFGARSIQDMFNNIWRQTTGEILSGPKFYPEQNVTATIPCRQSCFAPLFHSPVPDLEKNLAQLLWLSANGAEDHIYMETPYLLPDDSMLDTLKEKARSGVRVEIIVPGPYIDSRIVQAASRSYYNEMLDAGIKIYEFQPAHLHSKIYTADGHWSVIGSANLDNRSSTLNIENVFAIEDKKLGKELDHQFELDRAQAQEIKPGSFQTNFFSRAIGSVSRLFAKQY
jgi:cardiolipin synthase A/B